MNLQERMEMLQELSETIQDVIRGGWMEHLEHREEDYRVRWQDDGTGVVMRTDTHGDATGVLRFQVEVTCSVVEPEPNRPASANYKSTAWERVPAGWFVMVPNGDAWEVMATENQGIIQVVTLRSPDGKLNTARRPAEKHVPAVAGTHTVPWDVEGTFAAFPSSQIISDGGQA